MLPLFNLSKLRFKWTQHIYIGWLYIAYLIYIGHGMRPKMNYLHFLLVCMDSQRYMFVEVCNRCQLLCLPVQRSERQSMIMIRHNKLRYSISLPSQDISKTRQNAYLPLSTMLQQWWWIPIGFGTFLFSQIICSKPPNYYQLK